jgi:hypothetical protein
MPTYVPVAADKIEDFLKAKGFSRSVYYNEVVYSRDHDENPNIKIKVYTSIRVGQTVVRGCGADSIKICTVFDDGQTRRGVGKFPHVLRVGSEQEVLDRMLGRMRQAYKRGSDWLAQQQGSAPTPAPVIPIQWNPYRGSPPEDGKPRGGVMTEEEFARIGATK